MKEAYLYKKLSGKKIQCRNCAHYCVLPEGKTGICGVRKNIGGKLYSLVYGKAATLNIDPIEKKPLFHFKPGSQVLSFGTYGCNFGCNFCQNWEISQTAQKNPEIIPKLSKELAPQEIVQYCKTQQIPTIAYTYNEPTVFLEYALDTMKLAREAGIKNVWVSNGYESKEALELIHPYLDAINIDLKSFSEKFYKEIVKAKLEPVKETIKRVHKLGVWEEITTLIIPNFNDSSKEFHQIAKFIYNINPNIPWHLSAFFPAYKMNDVSPTPKATLLEAYKIAKKAGLKFVYIGNVIDDFKHQSTYCPRCGSLMIKREGYQVIRYDNHGYCSKCKENLHIIN